MKQINPVGVTEFCQCEKCRGEIDYEIEHLLLVSNKYISRWCANHTDLESALATMPLIPRTNAEYELKQRGPTAFYVIYYNAPLDPVEKNLDNLHPLFKDIGQALQDGIKYSRLIEDQYTSKFAK
jgi:hypothetical protein